MVIQYKIGGFELYLPDDHQLERYQSIWHLYDRALSKIAKNVFIKYPHSSAIDIGANVGDSAALIQEFQSVPTLCIEGNPEYFEYLEYNAEIIGNIQIADCFIGRDGETVNLELMNSYQGTTSIINAINSEGMFTAQMHSLELLLQEFTIFQKAKLLKIDTDGFDFKIITQSQNIIKKLRPIIYFEYDISFQKESYQEALAVINLLISIGYKKFVVYDNFGNCLISLSSQDSQYFFDLTNYLISNLYKSGQPAVYYFDICAFHDEDIDVFAAIYNHSSQNF